MTQFAEQRVAEPDVKCSKSKVNISISSFILPNAMCPALRDTERDNPFLVTGNNSAYRATTKNQQVLRDLQGSAKGVERGDQGII